MNMMYTELKQYHEQKVEETARQYQTCQRLDEQILGLVKALISRVRIWFGRSGESAPDSGNNTLVMPSTQMLSD
jgi:hypothetical protein